MKTNVMTRTILRTAHVAFGALAIAAVATNARAQRADDRWSPWLGCWKPVASQPTVGLMPATVCVVPAQGTSAVEVVSVVGSAVTDRTRIEADGAAHAVKHDDCTGTERAQWAMGGTRVYVSETMTCPTSGTRKGSGIMSFSARGEWLDVHGVSTGPSSGVAVARYEPVFDSTGIPAELRPAVRPKGAAAYNALLAASAPLTIQDLADVATMADSSVAMAWMVERTQGVTLSLDGKQLAALADMGVQPSMIDILVAISHPTVFALNHSTQAITSQPQAPVRTVAGAGDRYNGYCSSLSMAPYDVRIMYDPFMWSYGMYSPYFYSAYYSQYAYTSSYCAYRYGRYYGYGSPFYSPYGYTGYGYSPYGYSPYGYYSPYYGWYAGNQPVVIVNAPSNGGYVAPHGRVVKGQGYSGSGSSGTTATGGSSSSSSSSGSSGGSSSSAAPASSSGGSSSGGDAGRTAVKKPPQ